MPISRSHTSDSGFVWDNKFVLVGGRTDDILSLDRVDVYDPATDSWSTLTPLPEPRHSPIAVYVGGRFVVTTGFYEGGGVRGFESSTFVSNLL